MRCGQSFKSLDMKVAGRSTVLPMLGNVGFDTVFL